MNVRSNAHAGQECERKLQNRAAIDESYSVSCCCSGKRFIAIHSEMRDHTLVSGEGQLQGGVKARRIMQDLVMRDKRKEREALAHPGEAKLTLTPFPEREGILNWL